MKERRYDDDASLLEIEANASEKSSIRKHSSGRPARSRKAQEYNAATTVNEYSLGTAKKYRSQKISKATLAAEDISEQIRQENFVPVPPSRSQREARLESGHETSRDSRSLYGSNPRLEGTYTGSYTNNYSNSESRYGDSRHNFSNSSTNSTYNSEYGSGQGSYGDAREQRTSEYYGDTYGSGASSSLSNESFNPRYNEFYEDGYGKTSYGDSRLSEREIRELRELREAELRSARDYRELRERDYRESRDSRDPRDSFEGRGRIDSRHARELNSYGETRAPRSVPVGRNSRKAEEPSSSYPEKSKYYGEQYGSQRKSSNFDGDSPIGAGTGYASYFEDYTRPPARETRTGNRELRDSRTGRESLDPREKRDLFDGRETREPKYRDPRTIGSANYSESSRDGWSERDGRRSSPRPGYQTTSQSPYQNQQDYSPEFAEELGRELFASNQVRTSTNSQARRIPRGTNIFEARDNEQRSNRQENLFAEKAPDFSKNPLYPRYDDKTPQAQQEESQEEDFDLKKLLKDYGMSLKQYLALSAVEKQQVIEQIIGHKDDLGTEKAREVSRKKAARNPAPAPKPGKKQRATPAQRVSREIFEGDGFRDELTGVITNRGREDRPKTSVTGEVFDPNASNRFSGGIFNQDDSTPNSFKDIFGNETLEPGQETIYEQNVLRNQSKSLINFDDYESAIPEHKIARRRNRSAKASGTSGTTANSSLSPEELQKLEAEKQAKEAKLKAQQEEQNRKDEEKRRKERKNVIALITGF